MEHFKRARRAFLATTALAGLSPAFALAQQAPAQQTPTQQAPAAATDESPTEAITVTGQRASNVREIAIKHDAIGILDGVAANEVGELPDFNVADALKRVSGINVLLYQGEPRFITIRGFDANYNSVNIDGFSFATPDPGGRQVYMEVLPSDIAQHIDVYKSGAPDLDGHAVGGVVNLVTPSAFDYPDDTLVGSVKGGFNLGTNGAGGKTPTGEGEVRGSALFGPDKQFGIVLTANYWTRDIHVPQEETEAATNWYNPNGTLASGSYGGNGIPVPSGRLWYNYTDDRYRYGISDRIDWHPNDAVEAHISMFDYYQHETAERNDLNATVNATSKDLNETTTSGLLTSVNQYAQLANLNFTRQLLGVNGATSYTFGDDFVADLRGSFSRSNYNNPQVFDKFTQSNLSYTYDTSGTLPVFTPVNVATADNLSLYKLTSRQYQDFQEGDDVVDLQSNFAHNVASDDRGFGFKVGARWVETTQNNGLTQATYSGAPYTLANVASGSYICGLGCNGNGIPLISENLANQLFQQYSAQFLKAYAGSAAAKTDLTSELGGDYTIQEDIVAGYGLVAYATDWWRVQGGLRLEHTDFTSNGYETVNGVLSPVTANKSYNDPLPSITATINTSDTSLLRLAASETIGRPRYSDEATHGGSLITSSSQFTLAEGNADLKPRRSDNLDISHEWYLDNNHGIFSIGGFSKRIHDEIFNFGQTEDLIVDGVTAPVLVTQARNSAHTATVLGTEVSFVHDLDFLPPTFAGFGVSANAMISRTSFPITLGDGTLVNMHELPEQANRVFNAALYYDTDTIHARIAYNHTGKMWDDRYSNLAGAATYYENRDFLPSDHVDLQVSYQVTPNFSVDFSALNITSAGVQENDGRNLELGRQFIGFSPTVMLGVTAKM